MRFRFHRGGYTESMVTQIEVGCLEDLKEHIYRSMAGSWPSEPDIYFEYYGHDERNGWDTWLVIVKDQQDREYPIGMSDAGSFD
jgi:hypothetical protein